MSEMSYLANRMKYLCKVEAGFALALPLACAAYWISNDAQPDWVVRVPALALVSYILAQGAMYWGLKYRQYALGQALPHWLPAAFRRLRLSNLLGLGAAAVVIVLATTRGVAGIDLGWAAGLWLFAALEHINYYAVQLMYDTSGALRRLWKTRRLRTAMLASDLKPG